MEQNKFLCKVISTALVCVLVSSLHYAKLLPKATARLKEIITFQSDLGFLKEKITFRRFSRPARGTAEKSGNGVDISTKEQEITAAGSGEVIFSGEEEILGNCVKIKHKDGYETLYSGLLTIVVSSGDRIAAGQKLGTVSEKFHFEVIKSGVYIDPFKVTDRL